MGPPLFSRGDTARAVGELGDCKNQHSGLKKMIFSYVTNY